MAQALNNVREIAARFPQAWEEVQRQVDEIRDATDDGVVLLFVCASLLGDGFLHASFAHNMRATNFDVPPLITLKAALGRMH